MGFPGALQQHAHSLQLPLKHALNGPQRTALRLRLTSGLRLLSEADEIVTFDDSAIDLAK